MTSSNRVGNSHRNSVTQLNKLLPVPIQLEDGSNSEHFSTSSHITDVLVGDYHIVQGEGGVSYVVWSIRIIVNDSVYSSNVIYKRYSDIERFRQVLVKHFPKVDIPPLPPKDNFSIQRMVFSDNWLENRRKGLQWFMTNVLLNPKLQHSSVIMDFILR